jgi:hypothetical protein
MTAWLLLGTAAALQRDAALGAGLPDVESLGSHQDEACGVSSTPETPSLAEMAAGDEQWRLFAGCLRNAYSGRMSLASSTSDMPVRVVESVTSAIVDCDKTYNMLYKNAREYSSVLTGLGKEARDAMYQFSICIPGTSYDVWKKVYEKLMGKAKEELKSFEGLQCVPKAEPSDPAPAPRDGKQRPKTAAFAAPGPKEEPSHFDCTTCDPTEDTKADKDDPPRCEKVWNMKWSADDVKCKSRCKYDDAKADQMLDEVRRYKDLAALAKYPKLLVKVDEGGVVGASGKSANVFKKGFAYLKVAAKNALKDEGWGGDTTAGIKAELEAKKNSQPECETLIENAEEVEGDGNEGAPPPAASPVQNAAPPLTLPIPRKDRGPDDGQMASGV